MKDQKDYLETVYDIYIIISVRPGKFWSPLVGIGRAIARWNRLDVKMLDRWEFLASRAPRARSAHKLPQNV